MIEEEEEEKVYGRLLRALDVVLSAIPKDALLTFRYFLLYSLCLLV